MRRAIGTQQTRFGQRSRVSLIGLDLPTPGRVHRGRSRLRPICTLGRGAADALRVTVASRSRHAEGQTIAVEWWFAEGKNERLPDLADELVRLKVDVIFAVNTPAALAAKKAPATIPIATRGSYEDRTRPQLVPS